MLPCGFPLLRGWPLPAPLGPGLAPGCHEACGWRDGLPVLFCPTSPRHTAPLSPQRAPASLCAGKGTVQGVEGTCLPQLAFLWDFLFAEILPFFFCFVFFYFSKR